MQYEIMNEITAEWKEETFDDFKIIAQETFESYPHGKSIVAY